MGLVLVIAILTSFYLTPVAMRLAWKCDAVSRPDGYRKKHARPTPEWGGIAVNASLLVGIGLSCLLLPIQASAMPLLAAMALAIVMLCLLGCYDDLCDMRPRVKLLGQIATTIPLILVGAYIQQLTLFGMTFQLGWIGIPWTVAWLVLGINALNLIDGMDGLASTVGIVAASAIAVVAALTGNTHVAALALVLAGALGGFLAHNAPPARIYLGDCGSMVIGLVLATLCLQVSPQPQSVSMTALAALLFLPLYDTFLAVVRRGLSGRGIMAADHGHIHHRLLDAGYGVWGSLAVFAGVGLATGMLGCFVLLTGWDLWAQAALVAIAAICVQLGLFGNEEWLLVKQRLGLARRRTKKAAYAPVSRRKASASISLDIANRTMVRSKQLDGLPQAQAACQFGVNARMADAHSISSASAGKKYVELFG
jgi:UDP-GlcNAc:undecaprenyl-phosphate/decaprenyl-phosphate GlcNAc-1-phosphate transferase